MSINTLVTSNTSNNPRRLTPEPFVPVGNLLTPTAYVRPADWPALDVIGPTDQKFSGLYAVNNTSMEYVALRVTGTGTITINWGDGTSETMTSGVTSQHLYDYATLATSVTSRGYKTALVNVTTTGTITIINTQVKPVPASPNNALPNSWSPRWLDIALGSPNLTSIVMGNASAITVPNQLEQISIISISSTFTPGTSLFQYCTSLQSVPTFPLETISTNKAMNSMFMDCWNLVTAPNLNFNKNTDFFQMFSNCYKLVSVPAYDTSNATSVRFMFNNCLTLKTIPTFDYAKVTNASSMFNLCVSLEDVGTSMNFSSLLTNTSSMFNGCTNLKIAPYINTINVTNMSSMFSSCIVLTTVPLYNTGNVTTTGFENVFATCYELQTIPGPLDLSKITSLLTTFSTCYSLIKCPILKTSSLLISTNQAFVNCFSLISVPLFDTQSVTNFGSMFSGCSALVSIPEFNTSKATSMASTFAGCTTLKTIPALNTINVTATNSMFSSCRSLQYIPNLNTSNVLNASSMFNNCPALVEAPTLDFTKVTAMNSIFTSCTGLLNANNIANTGNVTNMSSAFSSCISLREAPNLNTIKVTNMTSMFQTCQSLLSIPTYNTSNVTDITSFVTLANTLVSIPALNFSNVTVATNPYASSNNITSINVTGMKVSHSLTGVSLGKTDLENYFQNSIVGNTTAQTLTITGIPGATTALAKTGGITANSSVITMANTVGVLVGTYIYGTGITTGIQVSFIGGSPDSTFTYIGAPNHSLQNGDSVMFTSFSSNPGLTLNTQYYVVNRTSTNFQVASTPGGTRIILSVTSAGVMSIGGATIANKVNTVTSNVSIAINGIAQVSNASASLTNRALNQNYATTKNWIITG